MPSALHSTRSGHAERQLGESLGSVLGALGVLGASPGRPAMQSSSWCNGGGPFTLAGSRKSKLRHLEALPVREFGGGDAKGSQRPRLQIAVLALEKGWRLRGETLMLTLLVLTLSLVGEGGGEEVEVEVEVGRRIQQYPSHVTWRQAGARQS